MESKSGWKVLLSGMKNRHGSCPPSSRRGSILLQWFSSPKKSPSLKKEGEQKKIKTAAYLEYAAV